ncbi:hypothetical protein VP01_7394g1, partial [Puccinia sorghi]
MGIEPCCKGVTWEGPLQAKLEVTLASGVVVGAEGCPPMVVVEVWVVQSNELFMFGRLDQLDVNFPKKSKGKETAGPSVPVPGKKKASELAKCAFGGESKVALSLKERVIVSPMMVEELILVIWESAGLKADVNHVSFDVWLGEVEPAAEVPPGLHSDTAIRLLGYVQMCMGDFQVWVMIGRGSMVNLLPTELVLITYLVRQQANIGLQGIKPCLVGFAKSYQASLNFSCQADFQNSIPIHNSNLGSKLKEELPSSNSALATIPIIRNKGLGKTTPRIWSNDSQDVANIKIGS